ncbi:MAG: signal peptidase II [Gammaproteobacteria bacterium]|nr:signal peptidase II [Gammaproteobacteria bacterium]MDH5629551.1 signal peptidase II [Gammaproteobacteria bacterium]
MHNLIKNLPPVRQSGLVWLWLTVIFYALDQYTKYLAETYIQPGQPIEVMPFFNLVIRYNSGAAFSFLADAGGWQVYFFSILTTLVSVGILYYLAVTPKTNRWLSISLCLVLAGALGNLHDRVTLGYVIDFIDWYYDADNHWPAFNIADSVILIGAVMLLLEGYVNKDEDESQQKAHD